MTENKKYTIKKLFIREISKSVENTEDLSHGKENAKLVVFKIVIFF